MAAEAGTQSTLADRTKPGAATALCDALAEKKINILALTVSDTVDHAVVRMVVSDTQRALHIFGQHGVLVVENEVLMIENDNRAGSLGRVAQRLAEAKVNIDYAYLATSPKAKKGLLIVRVNNPKKGLEAVSRP